MNDLLHPAEFHFSYRINEELTKRGHEVIITARGVNTLIELLENSGLNYVNLGKKSKNKIGLLFEYINRTTKLLWIAYRNKIDIFYGASVVSVVLVGFLLRIPTIYITELEEKGIKTGINHKLSSRIYTPVYFKKNLGDKQRWINTIPSLTYLDPKYFTPQKTIVEKILKIDLNSECYYIVRFCNWDASHDINEHGFSSEMKEKIIEYLLKFGRVYVMDESNEERFRKYKLNIPKHLIHHVIAFSSMVISETTTITLEAALLGVPSIRCTSLVDTRKGGAAMFEELEKQGLVYNYSNENTAFEKMMEIIVENKSRDFWVKRKDGFISKCDPDIVKTLADAVENYQ